MLILENADEILEFIESYGYDEGDIEFIICKDDRFGGCFAQVGLLSDGEVLAETATWESARELKQFISEQIGEDYNVRKSDD